MFNGWMSYAGTEIINEARLMAYAPTLGITVTSECETCATLPTALDHTPYTTPAADDAPWYDANAPESAQVAGFQLTYISGVGDTSTRRIDELARDGAIIGARRRASRNLQIGIRAVATTECAITYAMGWLAKILRGSDCANVYQTFVTNISGCASETLCMFTCCPTTVEDAALRLTSLHRVGTTAGPTLTSRTYAKKNGEPCQYVDAVADVTFTAGDPGWYSNPETLIDTPLEPFYEGVTSQFVDRYNISELCDPFAGGDLDQLACAPITPLGCTPTEISASIAELPIPCIGIPDPREPGAFTRFNHYSIPLNLTGISSWADLIPRITYQPGQMSPPGGFTDPQSPENFEGPVGIQIRRVTPDTPCGTIADPCDVCLELFAPSWSRWTPNSVDWIERKAFRIDTTIGLCPFPLYTRGLGPFQWPTLTCGSEMCIDIFIATASDARTGVFKLEILRRQDAQA